MTATGRSRLGPTAWPPDRIGKYTWENSFWFMTWEPRVTRPACSTGILSWSAKVTVPFRTYHPHTGFSEQAPAEWFAAVCESTIKYPGEKRREPLRYRRVVIQRAQSQLHPFRWQRRITTGPYPHLRGPESR